MIAIGTYNTLTIDRDTNVGLFLTDGQDDVLLPNKYVPNDYRLGDLMQVFVYLDHEERPVATTLEPLISLHEFAFLKVNYVNEWGAFMDWGLEKDLFVPFQEQVRPMDVDQYYLVYLYIDERSNRLVASSKTNRFIVTSPIELEKNEEVTMLITHFSDLGANVIINHQYRGLLLYQDLGDRDLEQGDTTSGYIKNIREDGKIDVSLEKVGIDRLEEHAQHLLDQLMDREGFIALHDHSSPEDIESILNMSKKTFKKAAGILYKYRLIELKDDGIYLVKQQ
jgi:hypothetical protein